MVTVTSFTYKDIYLHQQSTIPGLDSFSYYTYFFSSFAHSSISSQFFCLCVVYSFFFFRFCTVFFERMGMSHSLFLFSAVFFLFFYILDGGKKFIIVVAFLRSRKIQYFYISVFLFFCVLAVFSLFSLVSNFMYFMLFMEKNRTQKQQQQQARNTEYM